MAIIWHPLDPPEAQSAINLSSKDPKNLAVRTRGARKDQNTPAITSK